MLIKIDYRNVSYKNRFQMVDIDLLIKNCREENS